MLSKNKLTYRQILIESLLLAVFFINIYLLISIFSYHANDPSWSQAFTGIKAIQNIGGAFGAFISDVLLQFFGFTTYVLPLIGIFICTKLATHFYKKERTNNYITITITLLTIIFFIFSLCGICDININDLETYRSGGVIGAVIASEIEPVLGTVGATLILLLLLLFSIVMLTGKSWLVIVEMIGRAVVAILKFPFFIANKVNDYVNQRRKKSYENDEDDSDEESIEEDVELEEEIISLDEDEAEVLVKEKEKTKNNIECVLEPAPVSFLDEEREYTIKPYHDVRLHKPQIMDDDFDGSSSYFSSDDNGVYAQGSVDLNSSIDDLVQKYHDTNTTKTAPSRTEDEWKDILSRLHNENITENLNERVDSSSIQPSQHVEITQTSFAPKTGNVETGFTYQSFDDDISETSLPDDSDSNIEPKKSAQEESLIHPLLMRHETKMAKPKTPLPQLDLLSPPPIIREVVDTDYLQQAAARLEKSLLDFRVKAKVVGVLPGPVVTLFELDLAPGVKASRISVLSRDLARALSAASVRVVEVIPNKPYVGLELPNKNRQTVYFREVLDSAAFKESTSPLTLVLGKDISGKAVVADLKKMPHLLVAGTTGSGKSVGVNAMILSILFKATPEDVRFIMIDPKMLELSVYEGIPHLLTNVVTDMKDAANALNWCVNEMERRYKLMSAFGVRNIAGYNDKIKQADEMQRPIPDPFWKPGDTMDTEHPVLEKLPYIVVIVDEFADLIMAVGKKVEELIARLAQKARAAGIHLVLATQRPSVDVITGLIKANIPTRIAFTVSSKIDSRTILDQMGAESLLGMGDMLYLPPNSSSLVRVHGAFVRDEEVHAVAQDWKARSTPKYIESITVSADSDENKSVNVDELDPFFDEAVAFVIDKKKASISSIQRQFRIGYNRAARIVEQMEAQGIVSEPNHSGIREVLARASFDDY